MTNFKPSGYRILVKLDEIEEKTKSGIILHTETERSRHQKGHDTGHVIGIGPDCWSRSDVNSRWCEVGEKVMFPRYAGHAFEEDGQRYHVMNDEDILGVYHD